jgi:hypothetical protein
VITSLIANVERQGGEYECFKTTKQIGEKNITVNLVNNFGWTSANHGNQVNANHGNQVNANEALIRHLEESGQLTHGHRTFKEEDKMVNTVTIEGSCWDDVSGQALQPDLVKHARWKELQEFNKHEVYVKVNIKECWDTTGKPPIGTKWIDINKGDADNPDYRSRLVAQEIKTDKREYLFAATPPLEALRMLLSAVMTQEVNKGAKLKLDFIDVKRAYFHALAKRDVYVKLPQEDREEGKCGKLNKAMYGTRDAALNWEEAYCDFMEKNGFTRGKCNPCLFHKANQEIMAVIHGDDFTLTGSDKSLMSSGQ